MKLEESWENWRFIWDARWWEGDDAEDCADIEGGCGWYGAVIMRVKREGGTVSKGKGRLEGCRVEGIFNGEGEERAAVVRVARCKESVEVKYEHNSPEQAQADS